MHNHRDVTSEPGIRETAGYEPIITDFRLVQALWDRMAHRPDSIPVPQTHLDELERRIADHDANPAEARPEAVDLVARRFAEQCALFRDSDACRNGVERPGKGKG